jgi:hypothetical protein
MFVAIAKPVSAIRACTKRLRGLGGNVHWEGCACWHATLPNHHHLQSCWQNNLDLEAVKGKIVAKVGVALLRPPTMWCAIFFLVAVRTHYDISYFFYRQHTSLFRTGNIATLHFQQNFRTAKASNNKISTEWSRNSASCLVVQCIEQV